MGILNFDWAQIAWTGSPLANPWWAQVNIAIGFFLFYWIIVPILYYTNVGSRFVDRSLTSQAWYTKHLPIMSVQAADRFGEIYNVTKLLTPEYTLNTTAYKEYSPVYLTATFTMTYMLAYALTTSLIVYTVLIHGKRLVQTIRRMQVEPDDIHLKLMRVYPEVPDWWYVAALAVCLVLGIVTVEVFPTTLPVWGYLVAVVMAFIYILPAAIMYALSNLEPAVNLIAELIPGFAFQGRPLAGMIFKTFAVQTLVEALYFVRDMKIGHYMKVPPRSMFVAQMSACAIACFVQVGVKTWMFSTIPDMCSIHQKDLLICSSQRTSYSASIIWGLIGPERLFSKGGIYNPQLWMMLVGALLPFPFWLWCRRYPRSIVRNINVCVIFCVCLFTPPASGINVASFLFVGFIFQYWVRRYRFAWWSKYNYVLSAALDVGTLISGLFIFLTIRLPGAKLNWWGNSVYKNSELNSRWYMLTSRSYGLARFRTIGDHASGRLWPKYLYVNDWRTTLTMNRESLIASFKHTTTRFLSFSFLFSSLALSAFRDFGVNQYINDNNTNTNIITSISNSTFLFFTTTAISTGALSRIGFLRVWVVDCHVTRRAGCSRDASSHAYNAMLILVWALPFVAVCGSVAVSEG